MKKVLESCIGAWLHNKRLRGERVSDLDEALVERLHRELGASHFRAMITEIRDEQFDPVDA